MKTLMIAAASAAILSLSACSKADAPDTATAAATEAEAMENKAVETAAEAAPEKMETTAAEAARWMAANAKRDGVKTLPSGLQYSVIKTGTGESPAPGDLVKVHYEGMLTNGEVFDSSYKRGMPSTFPSDRLIQGWVEALAMMKPGDEWSLFIPPNLAYGDRGNSRIPANSVLIFRMELLEVTPK